MRFGIFDLGSFFWTLAGARSKEEGAHGLALQVLRYMRERAEKAELDVVVLASDGPPEAPSRSWRLRVDPGYKGHRPPKDDAQRAELVALVGALESAGFPVVAAIEREIPPADSFEAAHPENWTKFWFEADDVAYSAAKKVTSSSTATLKFEAHVFSNDWDLAQVLAAPSDWKGVEHWENCIRLFTTRGEERTTAGVEREFGCAPAKLAELKALAGDPSDGYKPFPGEAPGKPGIGEKGAADLLKAFGSAHSAMAAALSNIDSAFAEKGIPKRIPALLRKGGEAALERGLKLATLRGDVPVPDDFEAGDWEEAEAALMLRANDQKRVAEKEAAAVPAADRVQRDGASEGRVSGPAADPGLPTPPSFVPGSDLAAGGGIAGWHERQLAERVAAGERATVPVDVLPPLNKIIGEVKSLGDAAKDAGASIEELERALTPMRSKRILLTEAEFLALAPLPALWAAGLIDPPLDIAVKVGALVQALADGELRPTANRRAFIGDLSAEAEKGILLLAAFASGINTGTGPIPAWRDFAEKLEALPRFTALADYGRPLVRAK